MAGVTGSSAATRVAVVTDIPSPYQVELFNAIDAKAALKLRVIYARNRDGSRPWPGQELRHAACFLDADAGTKAQHWIDEAQLVVFSGYRIPAIQHLMRQARQRGQHWAFWGERPGYRLTGALGRILRSWPMRHIRRSRAPLWGIGQWALEGYREELGNERGDEPGQSPRLYLNVPYFSDLGRFAAAPGQRRPDRLCRFLYSGQLVRRKGVDLLMDAFARLVSDGLPVELQLLGDGPLRAPLQRAAQGFARQVVFHGYQPWQALPEYYRNADFLCVPSRHDGWALVVPEGLAAGLPVIASTRTGAARQLLTADNGWLISPADSGALYAAMQQAAQCSAERYRCLSGNATTSAQALDLPAGVACFRQAVDQSLVYWENRNR